MKGIYVSDNNIVNLNTTTIVWLHGGISNQRIYSNPRIDLIQENPLFCID